MKRHMIALAVLTLAGCAQVPKAVPAGNFTSEADISLTLHDSWSVWPSALNTATRGQYLTKDGYLLNRLHVISLKDNEAILRATKDADVPRYKVGATESEIVALVTNSLSQIGYSGVEAENIRLQTVDGASGIRFGLTGKWENGLNVRGDCLAVPAGETLDMVLFMAPELHYYEASADEVDAAFNSVQLSR